MKCSILRNKCYLGLTAVLLLASCSQDELTEQGSPLPAGQYPLELTATIGEAVATPATRGTVHGTWPYSGYLRMVSSIECPEEEQINWLTQTELYNYEIDRNGTLVLNPYQYDPIYWRRSDEIIYICASGYTFPIGGEYALPWYVESDQSTESYLNLSDLLHAYAALTFKGSHTLNFRHLTLKITINLMQSDYLRAQDPDKVKVTLGTSKDDWYVAGKFQGHVSQIIMVEDDRAENPNLPEKRATEIIPYKNLNLQKEGVYATYEAVLIPQTITGTGKTIQIKVGETTYSYEVECSNGQYASGEEWIYNITVKEKGLDVTVGQSIGWGTDGATGSGEVELP